MRRTDRLFDLIQILRDGRLHVASEMATRLGVSVRTIWRDMTTLMESGLPVEGERGVGYILRSPITLPPMILTVAELEALRSGLRHVAEGEDPTLARAARALATKIAPLTPPSDGPPLTPGDAQATRTAPHLPTIRRAIANRMRLTLTYIDEAGRETHRDIRPLALEMWSRVQTLAAWCEAKNGFRSFRVDRIMALDDTGETFATQQGRTLADYRAHMADEG